MNDRALALLHEWVQSESLRKHCYAVAAAMQHFARSNNADADEWGAAGLLHDLDYEQYPQMPPPGDAPAAASAAILAGTAAEPPLHMHPFVAVTYLRNNGWSQAICRAILAHASYSGVVPETPMEKTLVAVDELSGFVTAVALVRPSKSVHEVEVAGVRKKMKDKAFARAVSRDDIVNGAAGLGMPLDELIGQVIAALQADAQRLGLAGT